MPSDPPWPRSPNDSAVKHSRRSLAWPSRIPFSPGTGNWWHTSSAALGRRGYPGRPRISPEVERLVVRMAGENRGWGYDRIVGALANLGHAISDRTVGNILRRHNLAPAPERSRTTSWKEFIRSHLEVLAGADFFTVGGPDLARAGDVLRSVLHRSRQP